MEYLLTFLAGTFFGAFCDLCMVVYWWRKEANNF